jgi:hypothetical protein
MTLLLYVALWVPISICLLPPSNEITTSEVLDIFVDIIFLMDMVVNFISAYDDPVTSLQIVSIRKIAKNYITGWFFIDLIALMPVQLL